VEAQAASPQRPAASPNASRAQLPWRAWFRSEAAPRRLQRWPTGRRMLTQRQVRTPSRQPED
jgi:hypothetical protein